MDIINTYWDRLVHTMLYHHCKLTPKMTRKFWYFSLSFSSAQMCCIFFKSFNISKHFTKLLFANESDSTDQISEEYLVEHVCMFIRGNWLSSVIKKFQTSMRHTHGYLLKESWKSSCCVSSVEETQSSFYLCKNN